MWFMYRDVGAFRDDKDNVFPKIKLKSEEINEDLLLELKEIASPYDIDAKLKTDNLMPDHMGCLLSKRYGPIGWIISDETKEKFDHWKTVKHEPYKDPFLIPDEIGQAYLRMKDA